MESINRTLILHVADRVLTDERYWNFDLFHHLLYDLVFTLLLHKEQVNFAR